MKDKFFKNLKTALTIIVVILATCFLMKALHLWTFLGEMENKTFDVRQNVISKYKNHNKDFYGLVEKYIPNYKEIDRWLKNNSNQIYI